MIGGVRIAGRRVPILRFMSFPPSTETTGEIEAMALYAGQGVGQVREIKPAAEIVRELREGARQIVEQRLAGALIGAVP